MLWQKLGSPGSLPSLRNMVYVTFNIAGGLSQTNKRRIDLILETSTAGSLNISKRKGREMCNKIVRGKASVCKKKKFRS